MMVIGVNRYFSVTSDQRNRRRNGNNVYRDPRIERRCKLSTARALYRDDFGEAKNEYILRPYFSRTKQSFVLTL